MELELPTAGPAVIAMVGAVGAAIAAFLPWVTARVSAGPVEVGTAATGVQGLGTLTFVLALAGLAVVLLLDWEDTGAIGTAVLGLAIILIAGWKVVDLGGPASPGIGLYLTLLGGVGVVAGGLWGASG